MPRTQTTSTDKDNDRLTGGRPWSGYPIHPPEATASDRTMPAGGLMTRRLRVGAHAVDVRATFAPVRPPIVLVHGIGMSGEYYLPLASELAVTHDVYVLGLPGYGTTPKPAHPLTVPELGEVVAESIGALGLQAPVVVGHSMGCQIVANAIGNHPGLALGYMLLGPTVDPAARSLGAQAWRLLRDCLGEPPATNAVIFRNYARMGVLRYLRTARYMLAHRIEQAILACPVPGLVVRGERDPIAPRRWAQQLATLAPDARLLEIPGGPHAVHHTRPREFAAVCAPFLASVNERRSGPRTNPAGV